MAECIALNVVKNTSWKRIGGNLTSATEVVQALRDETVMAVIDTCSAVG